MCTNLMVLLLRQAASPCMHYSYIETGYRPSAGGRLKTCVLSAFRLHNETVNIWSHALGAFYVIVRCAHADWRSLQLADRFSGLALHAGTVICLVCSSLHHLLVAHSSSWAAASSCADRNGIVVAIWATHVGLGSRLLSSYPTTSFAMQSASSIGAAALVLRSSTTRDCRPLLWRFLAFGAVGVPMVALVGSKVRARLVIIVALYVSGSALYWLGIPERFAPGYFDIWGASHQIMHMCVLLAIHFTLETWSSNGAEGREQ